MDELTLPISYKGEKLELQMKAYPYGYTYRLEVKMGEDQLIFEPDEEGNFRAFAPVHMDKTLIAIIAAELQKLK